MESQKNTCKLTILLKVKALSTKWSRSCEVLWPEVNWEGGEGKSIDLSDI